MRLLNVCWDRVSLFAWLLTFKSGINLGTAVVMIYYSTPLRDLLLTLPTILTYTILTLLRYYGRKLNYRKLR